MRHLLITLALALTLLTSGCGQMGPLYEPEESAAPTGTPVGEA